MTGLKCPFCHKRLQNDDLLCSCINEKCEESFDMVGTELLDGYFNPVAIIMNQNDMLVINAGDQNCIMFVKEINNGNVKLG